MTGADTAGFFDVEPQAAIAFFDRVGGEPPANRCAGWRAIIEVEASIMLRAFDNLPLDQTIAEVGISVGTDAIGGVEFSGGIAVKCECLFQVIEADHVFIAEVRNRTDFDPAVRIRLYLGVWDALLDTFLGLRELALDVIARIFDLFEYSGNDFPPRG